MSEAFESKEIDLMASALRQALDRLRVLGLVNGDATRASSILTKLIVEAIERGERNEENLILFAIGRFQSQKPSDGASK